MGTYTVSYNTQSLKYFFQRRAGHVSLIEGLPDSDKGSSDYLVVSGNFQATDGPYQVPTAAGQISECRPLSLVIFHLAFENYPLVHANSFPSSVLQITRS